MQALKYIPIMDEFTENTVAVVEVGWYDYAAAADIHEN